MLFSSSPGASCMLMKWSTGQSAVCLPPASLMVKQESRQGWRMLNGNSLQSAFKGSGRSLKTHLGP